MAMSLNGIIAGDDGNEDFLSNVSWPELVRLTARTRCLIWGRKTYEAVRKWNPKYLKVLEKVDKVILSRQSELQLDTGFRLAISPTQALEMLTDKGYSEVILTGGSTNNSSFAKKRLIDEVIVDVEPIIEGSGVPLFLKQDFELKMRLLEIRKLNDNVLQLHYNVTKTPP
jgi:dihydrofolate reductase